MTDVLQVMADLVIIIAGVVMTAAGWHWIANNTWRKWRENRLWKEADRKAKKVRVDPFSGRKENGTSGQLPPPEPLPDPQALPEHQPFVIYEMADASMVYDEFQWVTDLAFFDDRDDEIRLVKTTYAFVSSEIVVLPDPNPIEEEDDDDDFPPPVDPKDPL